MHYIFSFIPEYIPILQLVSKEWYWYFKVFQDNYYRFNDFPIYVLLKEVIKGNEFNLLQHYNFIYKYDIEICWNAAKFNRLNILKWARKNDCPWDERTCSKAAQFGHLDCLQWARENGCPWDEDTCYRAALNGHLDCLQWARENGCPYLIAE